MRSTIVYAALLSALSLPTAVLAQDAPAAAAAVSFKPGQLVSSAEGRKIGRVDRVEKNKDGSPKALAIIVDSAFKYIPVSTVSAGEKGLVTSLSIQEVKKLK